MNQEMTPPAQIWIGSSTYLEDEITSYLQTRFCTTQCNVCATCMAIREKQFHAALWIKPEKRYTLETIEPLFTKIAFSLEESEQFFFILQDADKLSPAVSNALLKSIEEPPAGYHFIFCAQRKESLLPTIQSRCIVKTFAEEYNAPLYSKMIHALTQQKDPHFFLEALQEEQISEDESVEIVEALLELFTQQQQQSIKQGSLESDAEKKIAIIEQALNQPPMPGSSKVFLKNLFLQLQ
jgi:DNA polymerase III gamma/tau subunit